tara:strand:+ start:1049 stop:1363 length:315 start_codon:yes stop_codon:yes gene_type:complete
MASTLSGAAFPEAVRITLGGSNVQTQLNIPHTASALSVRFLSNAGAVAFAGNDGGTLGAAYVSIDADSWAEISLADGINSSKGVTSVYLSSATGSTVVETMIEG